MEELNSGVLVKFLNDLDIDGKNKLQDQKPVLVQIRSIIPVLKENGLWPNQGFFLKVSDLSHALYVSLPQEQDDMVLCNRLHIGQFIYVETLEAAYPVPMLKGISPLPGRHPCCGNPKDLLPIHTLEKFLGVPQLDVHNDVSKAKFIERPRCLSASRTSSNSQTSGGGSLSSIIEDSVSIRSKERSHSSNGLRVRPCEERKNPDCRHRKSAPKSTLSYMPRRSSHGSSYDRIFRKYRTLHVDKDCDLESMVSSTSTVSMFKRRSWSGREAIRVSEFSSMPLGAKPGSSAPSVSVSSAPASSRYESSDENSTAKTIRTADSSDDSSISETKKRAETSSARSSRISRKSSIKLSGDSANRKKILSSTIDKNLTKIEISWDLLPQDLVKFGQEVLRERDIALLEAVEALQEACAAERLLKCLRTYSELHSTKMNEQHQSVDKFFTLQDELSQTKQVLQSITSIIPPQTPKNTPIGNHSTKESLKLASERKRYATSWMKAALALDLNPTPDIFKTKNTTPETSSSAKRPTIKVHSHKPKPSLISNKSENNNDKEQQPNYPKGRTLPITKELADTLGNECRAWFLRNVEEYLDWVSSKQQSDTQVGEMMYRIKRVNDWLDCRCKESSELNESESEACRRVRDKIYGILLKHVERTAITTVTEC